MRALEIDAGQAHRAPGARRQSKRIEELGVRTIATGHGPTIGPESLDRAFEMMRAMPEVDAPPQPGQLVLDEMIASILGGARA